MEQNENIENNGFENFEDQERDKSDILQREKIANRIAQVAIVFLTLGVLFGGLGLEWQKRVVFDTSIGIAVEWSVVIFIGSYAGACIISTIARIMKKTKVTKNLFDILVLYPILSILILLVAYLLLCIICMPLLILSGKGIFK